MKYLTKIGVLFILAFVGLSELNAQNDTIDLKRIGEKKLAAQVLEHYQNYKNLTYKMDAEIEFKDKSFSLNMTYRNILDSAIWINLSHTTGIPVARILITPDSLKLINRIDNKYLLISFNEASSRLGYDISFEMVQSVFNARLFQVEEGKDLAQSFASYKVYRDSTVYVMQNVKKDRYNRNRRQKSEDQLIHKVWINDLFQIAAFSIEDRVKQQTIKVDYPKYQTSESEKYPKTIWFVAQNSKEHVELKMDVKKAEFNLPSVEMPFKILDKFEPMQLK